MSTFRTTSSRSSWTTEPAKWAIALGGLFGSGHVNAQVHLDKLVECAEIARLYDVLSTPLDQADCAGAGHPIIGAVTGRMTLVPEELCVLRSAPATLLNGFACMRLPAGTGADLTCVRAADIRDVHEYMRNYRENESQFAARESDYLQRASRCPLSQGDAGAAQRTLMPASLALIARFELGFVQGLGDKSPPDSLALHGFASVDPTLDLDASAIEFVHLLARVPPYPEDTGKRAVGAWKLSVDDMEDMLLQLNLSFREAGAPARVLGRGFDFERPGQHGVDDEQKRAWLRGLRSAVVALLEEEGFEAMDASEYPDLEGQLRQQMLRVAESRPYGLRDAKSMELRLDATVLMHMHRPRCARGGNDGATAAILVGLEPVHLVKEDFGGLGLLLMALGDCSGRNTETLVFVEEVLDAAEEQVIYELTPH